ncbi:MAG: TlpA family protein disulfide reductase [Desulfovibrionaceae bacterium]
MPRISTLIILALAVWCLALPQRLHADPSLPPMSVEDMGRLLRAEAPTAVVVMASWCGPCRGELPRLNQVYNELKDRGLRMVGVSLDIRPAPMVKMLRDVPADFPFYWVGEKAMAAFDIRSVPMLFLSRNGKLHKSLPGAHSVESLRQSLGALLEK